MSNHFSMGAINKITNKYEYPKIANKINKYKCPSCEKDVIFRNGKINQPHFAHYKSDNPCYYYDNPNETQIHKDAKLLMKTLLDNKNNISIHRSCNYCEQRNCGYSECINYDIFEDDYNNNTKAIIEYKFNYNNSNRSADIALLENDKIKYIFEICYKHKTKEENRPEPWFEIDAEKLIHNINSDKNIDEEIISIDCIRNYICRFCIDFLEKSQKERIEKEILRKREEEIEIERKKREQERKEEEQERKKAEKLKKENEEKQKQLCKCDIMIVNICICKNQKYELHKLSNNLFCINCNKWKCRCK
jgi:adenosyl cobinamide kinase/adenosyl cobinamide phosphate guanylyltransferase